MIFQGLPKGGILFISVLEHDLNSFSSYELENYQGRRQSGSKALMVSLPFELNEKQHLLLPEPGGGAPGG